MDFSDEEAVDEAKIRSLLIRERYYRDTSQWQKMRDSYHPDPTETHVNIQWYSGDIDGFINGTRKVTSSATATITTVHAITPAEIDIRGAKALSESLCTMTSRFAHEGFEFDKVSSVRLISRLSKVMIGNQAAWRMLSLECIYIRDTMNPVLPLPRDSWPQFHGIEKFRSSYRCAAWLLNSLGITVSDDMAGEDRRASVEEVLNRNREWIAH